MTKLKETKTKTPTKAAAHKIPGRKVLNQIKAPGDALMMLGDDFQNVLNLEVQSTAAVARKLHGKFAQELRSMTDKLGVVVTIKTVILIKPKGG